MPRILVVDDEPSICWGLERLARSMGHRVDSASSAEHGLALAAAVRPDLVLLDVRLPGMDGLTAIDAFRQRIGDAPIIVMTAFGDLSTAVTAVESDVAEYIVKPFDLAEIRAAIERGLRQRVPVAEAQFPVDAAGRMIGQSSAMRAVFKQVALAAKSDACVLISGECGVGKELAARAIHKHSDRCGGRFVVVDAAALDASSAEAELFGQVGAAGAARTGLTSLADRGTLFIDGVGALPAALQAKLIRVIEQNEVLPIGGDVPGPVNLRVVSATSEDLRERIDAGTFRRDLYFRLAAFSIDLPPLRQRRDDIPLLAQWFASQLGAEAAALTDDALAELLSRPWHGNVRELRGVMEHALVVARTGPILPRHFPVPLNAPLRRPIAGQALNSSSLAHAVEDLANTLLDDPATTGDVYDRFLEQVEPTLFAAALGRTGNRCAPAARSLGLHRTTLRRKLDRYHLGDADLRGESPSGA